MERFTQEDSEVSDQSRLKPQRNGETALSLNQKVNRVIAQLIKQNRTETTFYWLRAVLTKTIHERPDLAPILRFISGVTSLEENLLSGLTIGEIGVCYEALLAEHNRESRKKSGQFFTPDDVSEFMAAQSKKFPNGVWIDPCCGVGNLSWYLTQQQGDPDDFLKQQLILIDIDEVALKSAVLLLSAQFASEGALETVSALNSRATVRDFLSDVALPEFDYVIANPPYVQTSKKEGYETSTCRDLFAYFMERITKESQGFITVTPASYLSATRFQPLRSLLEREKDGGEVLVFDNVPDTLFRGYKYGSSSTSKTNFVRAAITVCVPEAKEWKTSPILRWQINDRQNMFTQAHTLLSPRQIGPYGEWAKVLPDNLKIWQYLSEQSESLQDLTTSDEMPFFLDVSLTPRYYISASFRKLERRSKETLYFNSEEDRNRAAVVLNSSVPYLWWRGLDGGVTLPKRVLYSTPIPPISGSLDDLVDILRTSEGKSIVTKLNVGKENENVKHPEYVVDKMNEAVIPQLTEKGKHLLYTNNMFAK